MPSLVDSWDSQNSYEYSTNVPALDTGKTASQREAENLSRQTQAAIQKSRKIKEQKVIDKAKAQGKTRKNRQTWNPAAVAGQAITQAVAGPLKAISNATDPIVAAGGEFVDKNLYGIKDAKELAFRKRQRTGDLLPEDQKRKEISNLAKSTEELRKGTKPLVESGKFILKGTGPGIIEDYGSQLIKAGQETVARVGEVIGRPVAPEQDPRSDRYIKAQVDFGLTPEDPTMAKGAEILKLINGARFLHRVAPQVGKDPNKVVQLLRDRSLDFFAGFIHADTSQKGGPTLASKLEDALPPHLKFLVPQAMVADPEYDNEARYRIAAGLEDMGLSQVAEAVGSAFKALDIFQKTKQVYAKVLGKNSTAEAIDEAVSTLNKDLDKTAAKTAVKETEEAIRWNDVNQLQRDKVLNKIDDLTTRQKDPWEDPTEIKKQLDDANEELKDLDNTIAEGFAGTPQGARSTTRIENASDVGKFEIPEAIVQNRIWITDAATKRANMSGGWRAKIDEALALVNDKDNLDALYRKYKPSQVKQILQTIDKTVMDGYQSVLDTAKSPEEIRDALMATFRNEGQTFTGEVGTEQLKSKAVLVTQAMMRRLSEKGSNIGADMLHSEANGVTGGNHFDRMVDQVAGLVMLRKEAWSLEAGRRLRLGKRWQQALDEVAAEGAEENATVLTTKMVNRWADHLKYLQRTGDPAARDEARMMALAMALSQGDPTKTISFANTIIKYSGKKALGMFYNNILSAPKTLFRNMAGSIRLVLIPTQIGIQGLIEGNDKLIGAAGAGYAAMFTSSLEAAHVAGQTFKSGVPASWSAASVITKVETAAQLDLLEMSAKNSTQRMIAGHMRWLDSFANWTELPSRLMMTSDDYLRTVAIRQKISMDAFNYASEKGAKDFMMNLEHATIAMGRGVDTKTGQVTDKALKEYGDMITFTNDPGWYAKKLEELVSGGPDNKVPVGRFVMPFIRTPANIMGYQLGFTPLIGKFLGGYRKALEAGDELALAELRGRESIGSLLLSIGYTSGTSGNMTGNAPWDPNERERWRQQGIMPRSIKIGNKWVSYAWFEPLSNWMAAAADLGHLSRYGDINEFNQLSEALVYAIAGSFTEKSYLANLDGISVILNPQDGFAKLTGNSNIPGNPNNFLDTMASAGVNMVNNMVPYSGARKAWANASDPYYREYDSLFQKTLATTWPGISKMAPYEPDILTGKSMLRSTGGPYNATIPFETLDENQSPVAQKLIDMNVWHKGDFKKATTGQVYTGEERAQIKRLMAKNGLEKTLAKHFESKEFKADEQRWKEGSLTPSERLVDPWYKRRTEQIFQESLNAAKQEIEATNPDFILRKNNFLQQAGPQKGGIYDKIINFGNPK